MEDGEFIDFYGLGDEADLAEQVSVLLIKVLLGQRNALIGVILELLVGVVDEGIHVHGFTKAFVEA